MMLDRIINSPIWPSQLVISMSMNVKILSENDDCLTCVLSWSPILAPALLTLLPPVSYLAPQVSASHFCGIFKVSNSWLPVYTVCSLRHSSYSYFVYSLLKTYCLFYVQPQCVHRGTQSERFMSVSLPGHLVLCARVRLVPLSFIWSKLIKSSTICFCWDKN